MRAGDPVLLRGTAKALAPVALLLAFGFAATGGPGAGLAGGALLALVVMAHGLVFGAAAAQRAIPAIAWRVVAALALAAGVAAACAPDWRYGPMLAEFASAAGIAAAAALAFAALAARAPTLRDEDW